MASGFMPFSPAPARADSLRRDPALRETYTAAT